ncbi:GCN5-like N-acetyltransferase [Niallia circulans]|uniref:Acetyltransferase n=1 Tax=Niallia circulans TaxID=1397 RepID=A0A0J1IJM7_NIACI|nr:GNAT family N-acetyltransferase [Niallia circulans]KLV26132.1 acetyltransferase [Niallia circulans]MCM2982600.1 GNAT family N-acetyltransferase [Niallia circulans]MDR4316124.1 GNAT family N-acetyltransferase [Niallia circulans]MED3837538.1 GNAT family N-acetyltransferase [Niallia circulans]MED4244608.1 GNAT family N-acetyltransferase [Niallia circulans]
MEVVIVKTDKELKDAFYVRQTVFVQEQNVPIEEEIDAYEEDSVHFVLYDDDKKPIGAGRYRTFDEYGKVERICILSTNRKGGAGKAVMNKIEEYALNNGAPALKLNAQTQAIPFYSKLGYEVISDEFLDAGIPHKTMIKHL